MIPETGFYRKVFLTNGLSPQTCPAMRNVIFRKTEEGCRFFLQPSSMYMLNSRYDGKAAPSTRHPAAAGSKGGTGMPRSVGLKNGGILWPLPFSDAFLVLAVVERERINDKNTAQNHCCGCQNKDRNRQDSDHPSL